MKLHNKYSVNKSFEYFSEKSTGSIIFQIDLEIFCPSTVKNHVVRICFGSSYQADNNIAGQ
ncbi:hypothetical protein HOF65_00035 [bacterium]|nr:hypothetical protein [bacterium]MBT3852441.1 hypothetical protein [bacterium]MBT4633224.1 hypothetical protein [bacterium]MBT6779224.1 hypothetical protein [bacterium]